MDIGAERVTRGTVTLASAQTIHKVTAPRWSSAANGANNIKRLGLKWFHKSVR